MEKLNIAEILRHCPKGMELDCTIFENVTFEEVRNDCSFPIKIIINNEVADFLTEYGCVSYEDSAKCVIFPKGKTTWEGFQRPFKDGDVVAFDNPHRENLQLFIFKDKKEGNTCSNCYLMLDDNELDLEEGMYYVTRLATKEEKEKLFKAINDKGYKWNAEEKKLEELIEPKFKVGDRVKHISAHTPGIVVKVGDKGYYIDYPKGNGVCYISFTLEKDYELLPNKFDITTLNPFDRVLVRDTNEDCWHATFYSHHTGTYFYSANGLYAQCIPFEDNKHLLGTKDDCNDYYKTWD